MDMNDLLRQHQIALINVGRDAKQAERQVHRILAEFYAHRIRALRASFGLPLAF